MSRSLDAASAASLSETLVAIVQRIVVHQDSIEIQMLRSAILRHLFGQEASVSERELQNHFYERRANFTHGSGQTEALRR